MDIEEALELIEDFTVDQLKALTQEDLQIILQGMSPQDRRRFFIEKNVKIFGGINQYVDDFLDKTNIKDSNYVLNVINSLRPVTFDWNNRDEISPYRSS